MTGPAFLGQILDPQPQSAAIVASAPLLARAGFKTIIAELPPSAFGPDHKTIFADARKCCRDHGLTLIFGPHLAHVVDTAMGRMPDDSKLFNPLQLLDWRPWKMLLDYADTLMSADGSDQYLYLNWEVALVVTVQQDHPFWRLRPNVDFAGDVRHEFETTVVNDVGLRTVNYDLFQGGYPPHSDLCRRLMTFDNTEPAYLAAAPNYRGDEDADPRECLKLNPPGTFYGLWLGGAPHWTPADLIKRGLLTDRAWCAGCLALRAGEAHTDAQRLVAAVRAATAD